MKRYHYEYETVTTFSRPVTAHSFLLRCVPAECQWQHVVEHKLFLEPRDYLEYGTDGLGNSVQYGGKQGEHDMLAFVSRGTVEQQPYAIKDPHPSPIYATHTHLTHPSEDMDAFIDNLRLDPDDGTIGMAMAICHGVNKWMAYAPGTTDNTTTAAEAFTRQTGVCQDFAHVMVTLCRMAGMKARYASGFIPGEGATHAWTEVWDEGTWRALDPTHDRKVDYGYIKLAHGRDAADCPVSRGIFTGTTTQLTTVRVRVSEEECFEE